MLRQILYGIGGALLGYITVTFTLGLFLVGDDEMTRGALVTFLLIGLAGGAGLGVRSARAERATGEAGPEVAAKQRSTD